MSGKIVLHGNGVSQPARSVLWALMVKDTPYEFKVWDPMAGQTKSPEFLKMNPSGLIPVLEDNGFFVIESSAILTYLAVKYEWTDLYPTDLQTRSRIDQYLAWHHSNTRKITTDLFRPLLLESVFGKAQPEKAKAAAVKSVTKVSNIIDSWLSERPFLCSSQPSLADFLCYCEYDQLEVLQLFDLSPFPNLVAWIARMKELPRYDESHVDLVKFSKFLKKKQAKL